MRDFSAVYQAIIRATHGAARIVQSREHLEAHSKGEVGNIVTAADEKSEECIKTLLREQYPQCLFLAEESDIIVTRRNFSDHELVFVVDPIDGTTNYKYGIPLSVISIGAWSYGKPIASVVYEIFSGDMYTAVVGEGMRKNGKLITNRNFVSSLKEAIIGSDWAYGDEARGMLAMWNRFAGNVMALRVMGSAVMGLVFVATGQYTCYVHNTMKPFDAGAGFLMLQELGLTMTNWDGEPYSIFDEKIIVSPSHLHDALRELSFGK